MMVIVRPAIHPPIRKGLLRMNENRLDTLMAFARAAQLGSLHDAARDLGVSVATISRRISRLEDRLHARLLTRTTRHVVPTEAGQAYLVRCQRVLDALDEAELSIVDGDDDQLSGRLRITTPGAFGRRILGPLLAEFSAAHPTLSLDVSMTDEQVDLVAGGIDVAIRMATLTDSSLVARRLADSRRDLCASPAYLARRGTPATAAALDDHDGLYFEGYGRGTGWAIEAGGERIVASPAEVLRTTDVELILRFALAGRGVAILPRFLTDAPCAAGELVRLLPETSLPESAVYAVHASRRHVPAKTRRFIDFLAERLSDAMRWSIAP